MSLNKTKLNESVERQLRSSIPFIAEFIAEGNKGRNKRSAKSSKKKPPLVSEPTPTQPEPQVSNDPKLGPFKPGRFERPMGLGSRIASIAKQGVLELGAHMVDSYRSVAQQRHEQSQAVAHHFVVHHVAKELGLTPGYVHMALTEYPKEEPLFGVPATHPDYANLYKAHKVSMKEYEEGQKIRRAIEGWGRANPAYGQFMRASMATDRQLRNITDDPKLQTRSKGLRQRAQELAQSREDDSAEQQRRKQVQQSPEAQRLLSAVRRGRSRQTP
jgi:hypothetical protein